MSCSRELLSIQGYDTTRDAGRVSQIMDTAAARFTIDIHSLGIWYCFATLVLMSACVCYVIQVISNTEGRRCDGDLAKNGHISHLVEQPGICYSGIFGSRIPMWMLRHHFLKSSDQGCIVRIIQVTPVL